MECPHCEKELKIPRRCYIAVETYGKSLDATTECCGKLIHLSQQTRFVVEKADPIQTEDDWGVPIKI